MKTITLAIFMITLVLLQTSCSNKPGNKQASVEATATDTTGIPDSSAALTESAAEAGSGASNESGVVINGAMLNQDQVNELKRIYGVEPKAGNYWYDARSGLYGVVGYGSYGFMKAGHHFGSLKRNASGGNTGVVVNGRELPEAEWLVWSQLLGAVIAPGSYWLDESGNAGNEGNPVPTVNLYAAAQANGTGASGGDNFWTSRFSAGNYNADNSQGYVSVPGYGPVGYGF